MKAESDSGLLFFPSSLEMGKECFLGRPESLAFTGTRAALSMLGNGQIWGGGEKGGAGGRSSWARAVGAGRGCVKAMKISWFMNEIVAEKAKGAISYFYTNMLF